MEKKNSVQELLCYEPDDFQPLQIGYKLPDRSHGYKSQAFSDEDFYFLPNIKGVAGCNKLYPDRKYSKSTEDISVDGYIVLNLLSEAHRYYHAYLPAIVKQDDVVMDYYHSILIYTDYIWENVTSESETKIECSTEWEEVDGLSRARRFSINDETFLFVDSKIEFMKAEYTARGLQKL